jgi:hypothetical protein
LFDPTPHTVRAHAGSGAMFNDLGNALSLPPRSCFILLRAQCNAGCEPAASGGHPPSGSRKPSQAVPGPASTIRPPCLPNGPSRLRQATGRRPPAVTSPSGDRSRDSGCAGAARLPFPLGSGHVTPAQAAGPGQPVSATEGWLCAGRVARPRTWPAHSQPVSARTAGAVRL